MVTRRATIIALLVFTTAGYAAAVQPLVLRVTPAMSYAPATLDVQVVIEPDSANRAVEIIAESGDFYRSSLVQLDGTRAPRVTSFQYRSVPAGEYELTGLLMDARGEVRAKVSRTVMVVARGQ